MFKINHSVVVVTFSHKSTDTDLLYNPEHRRLRSDSEICNNWLHADVKDRLLGVAVYQQATARRSSAARVTPRRRRDKCNNAHSKSPAVLVKKFSVPFVHF